MKVKGICKICREEKMLNYEHFPPRSAFNKNTRFYSIPSDEYFQHFTEYLKGKKPKGRINQGGLGDYCLCEDCNNFLGLKYVNDYVNFARICYTVINTLENFKSVEFKIKKGEVNLKNFLKQITSILICNNDFWFTEAYPELLEFVIDENYIELPNKYRFYMYLNNEGQIKNGNWTFDNINGAVCEFTFPPFGFILNIENENRIMELSEITSCKNYDAFPNEEIKIILNKYPTYSPIPLDFRDKDTFMK